MQLRRTVTGRSADVDAWLERLRISHLAERPIGTLSGGEAQRVSLARALILEPDLLFLDEPFSALDAPTRLRLTEELADLVQERGIATLLVSHDIDEAAAMCERCIVLDEGRVLQHDIMSVVLQNPASRRVAEIIGAPNIFSGRIANIRDGTAHVDWNDKRLIVNTERPRLDDRAEFVIQQDLVRFGAAEADGVNRIAGTVERIRRRRQSQIAAIRLANGDILHARADAANQLKLGEVVDASFPPEAVWLLPA
jgi:tungstate transport system ATP-binding protein